MHWLSKISEKPYFGSVLGSIWPKNFKTKSLSINPFASILSLYAALTCVNNQKSTMHLLLAKPEKLHLGSLLVRKPQSKIFPNKILLDQFLAYMLLQLYAKKQSKLWRSIFHKTYKTSFWANFGPCGQNTRKQDFQIFRKKSFRSTLKLYSFSANSWKQKNSTDFSQNLKNIHHFGPTLGTFQPKYLRTSKNQAMSIFKVDETQTLCRI